SGTVDRNCATFISGPFRPPRMVLKSSAWAALSVLMPRNRDPATRAPMPPTAPDVPARPRSSPDRWLSAMAGGDQEHRPKYLPLIAFLQPVSRFWLCYPRLRPRAGDRP